jgi:hypothetical protein
MLLYFDGYSHPLPTLHTGLSFPPLYYSRTLLMVRNSNHKILCYWCLLGVKKEGYEKVRVEGRGAKISDHVLRVPCEFGVRLGIVCGGEERGGG